MQGKLQLANTINLHTALFGDGENASQEIWLREGKIQRTLKLRPFKISHTIFRDNTEFVQVVHVITKALLIHETRTLGHE